MATIKQAAGVQRIPSPAPHKAGDVVKARFTFTASENITAADDIIEMGALPARAKLLGARLVAENLLAGDTLTVGFMSGSYGSQDPARTSGSEIFSAVAGNASEQSLGLVSSEGLSLSDDHRSIGLKLGQDVTGAANKKVHVELEYTMGC